MKKAIAELKEAFNGTYSNKSVNLNIQKETDYSKIYLIAFGDWHFGATECNEEAIKKQIDWVKNTSEARVILMGDLLNCGTKVSVGAGVYDDAFKPQEQYERVRDLLLPIKDKIYGIHIGNHEQRGKRKNENSLGL